ncbi:MAG TPA: TonB-dependent receptor [Bryobacteraceae bacterium]|nr:TonB-dependent receptor [Bryobacteraceae bacterium]
MELRSRVVLLLALGSWFVAQLAGQITTATIYARVTDPSGALVPGATVSVIQQETGVVTTKKTTGEGDVEFDFLRLGTYSLTIEAPGFKKYQSTGMALTAGQTVQQTYVLEVGQATESVQVEAEAPQVNTASAEQAQNFTSKTVTELPLARRNFSGVLAIGTGISVAPGGSSEGWRMNGVGRSGTAFSVDGTSANGNPEGRGAQNFNGANYVDILSMESIAEVSTVKGVLPAEYSGALGGQVNVQTRSGTNQYHGSLFENFQAEDLNAKDPFLTTAKPPFTYNQFGGSIGGPIVHDKIFIFGAYEGYRESRSVRVESAVPTQAFRERLLAAQPIYKAVLDTMPLPTQPGTPGAAAALFSLPAASRRRDNHVDVKGDIHLTNTSNLALTYSRGRPFQRSPGVQSFANSDYDSILNVASERATASYVMGGATWTSETRFGYNQNNTDNKVGAIDLRDPSHPTEKFAYGARVGQIVTNLGWQTPASEQVVLEGPSWNLSEKVSLHRGAHSLKFGGQYSNSCCRRENPQAVTWTYTGEADLFANIPSNINVSYGQGEYEANISDLGFFVQDDWRVTSRLTVNLGFRYDLFFHMVAKPLNNSGSILYNPDGLLDSKFDVGPIRPADNPYNSDLVNTAPRIGFAYDVTGKGRTIIRGGSGFIYSPQLLAALWGGVQAPKIPRRAVFSRQEAVDSGLKYPQTLDDFRPFVAQQIDQQGLLVTYSIINPNLQNPYAIHTTLGVQHQLTSSLMIESSFVGVLGRKFLLSRAPNEPDRFTGVRPNPKLNASYYIDESQTSHYFSWQNSLRKRFSRNFSGSAHYTWGKTIATNGGDTGAWYQGDNNSRQQNFFDVAAEKGPAVGDITHYFAGEMVYEVPVLSKFSNFAARQLLGNWQLSGIFKTASGQPLGITQATSLYHQRPDYVGGPTINENYNDTLQYLNLAAFAKVPVVSASGAATRPGTLGWGSVRGPGSWNVDFSLGKNFNIGEKVRLQLRTDMFNAVNAVVLTGITTSINSVTFGQARSTTGPRAVQLNARLSF